MWTQNAPRGAQRERIRLRCCCMAFFSRSRTFLASAACSAAFAEAAAFSAASSAALASSCSCFALAACAFSCFRRSLHNQAQITDLCSTDGADLGLQCISCLLLLVSVAAYGSTLKGSSEHGCCSALGLMSNARVCMWSALQHGLRLERLTTLGDCDTQPLRAAARGFTVSVSCVISTLVTSCSMTHKWCRTCQLLHLWARSSSRCCCTRGSLV